MLYLIIKKRKNIFIIDFPKSRICSHGLSIKINEKNNKVYQCGYDYISHHKKDLAYIGKLIYSSEDIQDIAIKFNELRSKA